MEANIYVEINGEKHIVSGDFSQAASPLWIDGEGTPYQVADARHLYGIAVAICLDHIGAANLPHCPAGMTPDDWRARIKKYADWDDVEYRDATEEEVERIESID